MANCFSSSRCCSSMISNQSRALERWRLRPPVKREASPDNRRRRARSVWLRSTAKLATPTAYRRRATSPSSRATSQAAASLRRGNLFSRASASMSAPQARNAPSNRETRTPSAGLLIEGDRKASSESPPTVPVTAA